MEYVMLAVTVATEITATTLLKCSKGFTKLLPTAGCLLAYLLSHYAFSKALDKLNLGIAYATWCGVGMVATALISVLYFKEHISAPAVFGLILIITGSIIVNLYGA